MFVIGPLVRLVMIWYLSNSIYGRELTLDLFCISTMLPYHMSFDYVIHKWSVVVFQNELASPKKSKGCVYLF